MNRASTTKAIQLRFTVHNLRAKAGSDAEENAQK